MRVTPEVAAQLRDIRTALETEVKAMGLEVCTLYGRLVRRLYMEANKGRDITLGIEERIMGANQGKKTFSNGEIAEAASNQIPRFLYYELNNGVIKRQHEGAIFMHAVNSRGTIELREGLIKDLLVSEISKIARDYNLPYDDARGILADRISCHYGTPLKPID